MTHAMTTCSRALFHLGIACALCLTGFSAAAQPTASASTSTTLTTAKKHRSTAPKNRTTHPPSQSYARLSPFVRLALSIITDQWTTMPPEETEAVHQKFPWPLLALPELQWAFGIKEDITRSRGMTELPPLDLNHLAIAPLTLEPGTFAPAFGPLFRPTIPGLPFELPPMEVLGSTLERTSLFSSQAEAEPRDQHVRAGRKENDPPLGYQYAMAPSTSVNANVSWIHDLGDATGLMPALDEPQNDGTYASRHSGVNLSLGAKYKAVSLTGGYIRALNLPTATELAMIGREGDPMAWNTEFAYATELLNRETTLALGYMRSSESLQSYLPEERYRTKASMALSRSTTFSLEYYLDREAPYRTSSDSDGYGITTSIGVHF